MKALFLWFSLSKILLKLSFFDLIKATEKLNPFMSSCLSEKETELLKKLKKHQKSKSCDSLISKNINLKLFIYNIEHKSNNNYLLLYFLIWLKQLRNIFIRKLFEAFNFWVEYLTYMFCALIILLNVINRIYSMVDKNSNTSLYNSDSETNFFDLIIRKNRKLKKH